MLRVQTDYRRDVGGNGSVAVAIDKDRNSQNALKWAIDNAVPRGQPVILIHVEQKHNVDGGMVCRESDPIYKEFFLPFRCFCTRKDIESKDVVLEDIDIAKAIVEYVTQSCIETLILGASNKTGFLRFKVTDTPGNILKTAPDFCTVHVISKGKIQTTRSASRSAPSLPLYSQLPSPQPTAKSPPLDTFLPLANNNLSKRGSIPDRSPLDTPPRSNDETDFFRSPFTRRGMGKSYGELGMPPAETDISFVSSGRPSVDRLFPAFYESLDTGRNQRLSNVSEAETLDSFIYGRKSIDIGSPTDMLSASISFDNDRQSISSQPMDDVESEMRRLKLELKQTMEMYSTACKEALTAKQKARELQLWKMEEERRLEEARLAEEAALAIVEREKAKSKAAMEAAEAAQRIAEIEARKRVDAEMKAIKESEEKKKALDALSNSDSRYRKYSIEEIEAATEFFSASRKIGEGGYGPVYKCTLDHTSVAIKVLRPDAAQGRSQFQQEVEVLSCIRHPNMVLLLGACPSYGCLIYEYMANGSLEDRLFRRGNSPPLSWQQRFRIACEIGTGLLFLHQAKPEPLVHRDLKPANILLDRNFVSKISDVGLARLVPPSVADSVTQYRMTSTAGTFCYIDPEYQQTGMLGIKSDIYSLGVMLLQIITAKSPMGLTHQVERSLENGTFGEMLDPSVPNWPIQEAESFARLSLRCAQLRRKDRPDLGAVVLPELERLRAIAEENMHLVEPGTDYSTTTSQVSLELSSTNESEASSKFSSTPRNRPL